MESIRISERNKIKNRSRDVESFMKFNANAIQRLRNSKTGLEFSRNKIEKLKKDNEEFSNELLELKKRECALSRGELDKELKEKYKSDTAIANAKTKIKRQQKLAEILDRKKKSEISREYYNKTMKARREARYAERSSKRGYDYLLRVHKSLPVYIRSNLENMPNNKGYIWRGVHYYGKKDQDSEKRVMFENKKGELHIHEWSPDNLKYTLTIKQNKSSRGEIEFVETFKRNDEGKRIFVSRIKPKRELSRKPKKTRKSPIRRLTPAEARSRSRGAGRTKPNNKQGRCRDNKNRNKGRIRGRGRGRGRDRGRGRGRGSGRGRGRGRGSGRGRGRGRGKEVDK